MSGWGGGGGGGGSCLLLVTAVSGGRRYSGGAGQFCRMELPEYPYSLRKKRVIFYALSFSFFFGLVIYAFSLNSCYLLILINTECPRCLEIN